MNIFRQIWYRDGKSTWARAEEIKKRRKEGKERSLQWQTGCSPRPPTLTQRNVVLLARWSSGGRISMSAKLETQICLQIETNQYVQMHK